MILNFCIALMNCGTTNSMHITRTRPGLSRVYPSILSPTVNLMRPRPPSNSLSYQTIMVYQSLVL
jgi:hypothetical protein